MGTARRFTFVTMVSILLASSVAVGYAVFAIAPSDESRNVPPIDLDETRPSQLSTTTTTIDESGVSIVPPLVLDLTSPPGPKVDAAGDQEGVGDNNDPGDQEHVGDNNDPGGDESPNGDESPSGDESPGDNNDLGGDESPGDNNDLGGDESPDGDEDGDDDG